MKKEFENQLYSIIDKNKVLTNEEMKKHTTFRVGGPADYFVTPEKVEDIKSLIKLCRELSVPYYIVGRGSNLLVGDRGYRGVMIQILQSMNQIEVSENCIRAQAGAGLAQIAAAALEHGLAGFEFAAGIPGTLGGAVVMNAGAYGGEMKDILMEATVMTEEGEVVTLSNSEMELGYRTSVMAKKSYIVLEALIKLENGEKGAIKARMEELREQRVSKQPLEYPSAGSTFKRPEGYFAGKLIQDAGLKGFAVGDAEVSEKHSGFVINRGSATAAQIIELMDKVSEIVEEKFGIKLEPEVKKIGEF